MRHLFFIIGFVLVLTSCSEPYVQPPASITSHLALFNASGYSPLSVALDGKTIASAINFGDVTGHRTITSEVAVHTLNLTAPGLSVEKSLTLSDEAYTAFFVNEGNSINVVTISDRSEAPAANNMMIRFMNLSTDAPAINIFLGKDQMATSLAFKQSTDFKERFGSIYNLEVRKADDNTLLLSANNVTISPGDYYTIALVGNVTPTSDRPDALALQLINP